MAVILLPGNLTSTALGYYALNYMEDLVSL